MALAIRANEISRITLLNTSIITTHGSYRYEPLTFSEVQYLVWGPDMNSRIATIQSAIGHQATAEILTELLETPVAVNRIQYEQQPGEVALVFKLKGRAPEGAILNREEIEKIGYEFGLLTRNE